MNVIDLAMRRSPDPGSARYFWFRRRTMKRSLGLDLRVFRPLVRQPQGELG